MRAAACGSKPISGWSSSLACRCITIAPGMWSLRPMRWCSWWSWALPGKPTWRGRSTARCAACGGTKGVMRRAGWRRSAGGGLASRSTADLREASAHHRDAEKPGDEQPGDCAPVGGQREGDPQAGWTFEAAERAQLAFAGTAGWPPSTRCISLQRRTAMMRIAGSADDPETSAIRRRVRGRRRADADEPRPRRERPDLRSASRLSGAARRCRAAVPRRGLGCRCRCPAGAAVLAESGLFRISRKLYGELVRRSMGRARPC